MKRIFTLAIALVFSLTAMPALAVEPSYGYDVSEPQCSRIYTLPTAGPFNVVGVNGGRLYLANSCLDSQLTWAGQSAELYVNTGNPGPNLSARYKEGVIAGKTCLTANLNSIACAFVYGYRGAENSYLIAQAAFAAKGWVGLNSRTWWLDVETSNSWRGLDANLPSDSFLTPDQATALNVANLQGATYYFESVAKVARLGIYSTDYQWGLITGGSTAFSDHASWKSVGTDGETSALNDCFFQAGFTGAPKTRVQYVDEALDLDVNVPCEFTKTTSVAYYSGVKSIRTSRVLTLRANLKTSLGTPMANQRVVLVFNRKTYVLKTNFNGIAAVKIAAPRTRGLYKVKSTFAGNEIIASSTSITNVRVY